MTEPRTRGHSFSLPVAVRQPTEHHPDAAAACPTCEHVYGRHEGVRTGRSFVFGHAEIARLLGRVGEAMSLRAASRDLREALLRVGDGEASRAANLAVNYLGAFARPSWPSSAQRPGRLSSLLDPTTLFTRGYRLAAEDPTPEETSVSNVLGVSTASRPREPARSS